jgi:hypothetical protein
VGYIDSLVWDGIDNTNLIHKHKSKVMAKYGRCHIFPFTANSKTPVLLLPHNMADTAMAANVVMKHNIKTIPSLSSFTNSASILTDLKGLKYLSLSLSSSILPLVVQYTL